jgi:hypothetical protein
MDRTGKVYKSIVKSFMKNRSGRYGKTRETLPLEGGGKRVGVKGLTGILPLTLTLSPKRRGKITLDDTSASHGGKIWNIL